MNIKSSLILLIVLTFSVGLFGEPIVYKVDPVHSGVSFRIRHFVNKIPGDFEQFEGEIHFDKDNPANSKAIGKVSVASINTRNEKRDNHLQNDDFFNAPANPTIAFNSTDWKADGENAYIVKGLLSMAGVEKEIELRLVFLGEMESRGNTISGWEGSAVIDRSLWGITHGKPAVGMEVEIELNIQARRQ